jgi:hypothetical protein
LADGLSDDDDDDNEDDDQAVAGKGQAIVGAPIGTAKGSRKSSLAKAALWV